MATSRDGSSIEDITLCSICFEKFKTPRFLPCTHSFCHGCLSSYIVSVCQSTEPRLGFNCPLCREYIPSPAAFDRSDLWAELFPLNKVLQAIVHKPDENLCDPCLRDNENETATGFCYSCTEYLCVVCAKHHRKQLLSRNHTVCQLNEMKSGNTFPVTDNIPNCREHKNEAIKFLCNDHQQACCSVCIGTKHRKCERVYTVEEAAKCIKENDKLDVLLGDVKKLEKKLTDAKTEQQKTISEMEYRADEIIEKTEREIKELVDHLEILKNKHLEEVAGALKKGRGKFSDCIDVLTDGIQCANYCCKNIKRVKETENNAEMVITYYNVKEKLFQLEQFGFTKRQITISESKSQILKKLKKLTSFGNVNCSESVYHFMYDVNDIALSLVSEFSIAERNSNVHTGNVLSNGNFVVANLTSYGSCCIYSKDWEPMKVIHRLSYPFEVIQLGQEILVTCFGTQSIEVFSASNLQKVRSININEPVRGITNNNGACFVACDNKVIKIDMYGKKHRKYNIDGTGNFYISSTLDGHLVFSNCYRHTVTAITNQGHTVWKYTNPRMKEPRGLDVDSVGNIFVAARESDNIHVLSGSGSLIRIIEEIPQPVFMKLREDRRMCYVCSNYITMKVYKL